MSEWRYLAFRADGLRKEVLVNGDLPLSDVSITKSFTGHSSLSAKISPEIASLQDADGDLILRDWATVIVAMNGSTVHFAGFLHPTEEQGHTLTLSASSYSTYPTGQPYTAVYRKYEITIDRVIEEIWRHLQGHTGGNLFLKVDASATKEKLGYKKTKRVKKTRTVTKKVNGKNKKVKETYYVTEVEEDAPFVMTRTDTTDLAQTLDTLCQQAGFLPVEKHKMSSTGVLTHTLVYVPQSQVGRKRNDLRFVVGENITEPLTVSGMGDEYASVVYVHGAGEGASQIREGASMSALRTKRIRRAVVVSDTSLKTRSLARARADKEIESRNAESDVSGQFTIIDHPNCAFGEISIGDEVYIQNEGGWDRKVRQWCYVTEMVINCQDNSVQVTVEARERRGSQVNESKRLVRYMNSVETRLENLERNKPQGYSSLDATSILIRDEDGNVTGKIGQLDDGSTGLITISPDPEVKEPRTLAVPSAPLLDQNVSAVAVTWDGLTVEHAELPLDFYCLEIHASEEQGFTADDLTLVSALYETEPSSAVVGPILKGTWYFKLRLRARNGEVSEASAETGIEVELDLPTLNGKIENASGGVNYYQPTPPTGEEPYPQASIWFDTSEDPETGLISYMPHHWTEADGWVSLEDQRIKAIEEAQADLTATVDELVNSPSGLKIHNSLGDPVSSGDDAEGDIWQKWDTLASGGKLLASWRFESGVWKSQSLAASYLPKVDIGTGTFGNLSGGRLELNSLDADRVLIGGSIGKTLIADGAVQTDHLAAKSITSASGVVGDLSAGNITFGTMSGLRIAAGTIYSTQLNSTAIDGMTITGATIRTSASGARVQMNLSGLSVYNNAGNRTFFADASNGALSIVGTLSTSNPGVPRVRIDNSLWTTGIKDESTDTFVDGAGIRIETAGGAIGGQLYSARYSATSGTSNRVVLTGPNPNSGHLAINQQGTAWIRNVPFDNSSSIEPLGTIQVWGDGTGYSGMVDNSVYERGASKRLISYARVATTRYSVGAPTVTILASDGIDSPNRGSLSFNSSGAFNTSVYDDQEIEAAFYYASPTTRMAQIAASDSTGTFNSKITQYGETGELNLYGKNTIRFDTGSSGDIVGLPIAGGHALVVIDKADTPASVAVTFPAGRFADAPNVSVTAESTVPGKTVTGVGATGITRNGFTAWATRTNTTNTGLQWTAVRGG